MIASVLHRCTGHTFARLTSHSNPSYPHTRDSHIKHTRTPFTDGLGDTGYKLNDPFIDDSDLQSQIRSAPTTTDSLSHHPQSTLIITLDRAHLTLPSRFSSSFQPHLVRPVLSLCALAFSAALLIA